jgi:hypothetical protein
VQETAPAAKPPAQAGAVALSEASAFILSLVAAHEGRAPADVLALLIAGAAEAVGIHSLIMRDAHDVDLAELPDFARRAANRFRAIERDSATPACRRARAGQPRSGEAAVNENKGGGP